MRFAVIDDQETRRRDLKEVIEENGHQLIGSYESLALAWSAMADVFIIDVGSAAGERHLHLAVGVMCSFFYDRPGVTVLFICGLEREYVDQVIRDIKVRVPDADVHFAGHGTKEEMKRAFDEYLR